VAKREENSAKCWLEWQDLNLRSPRPERGALGLACRPARMAQTDVREIPAGARRQTWLSLIGEGICFCAGRRVVSVADRNVTFC
jgi:hypothetical protein